MTDSETYLKGILMSSLLSKRAVEIFGACFLGSCLVGFVVFGTKIFNPQLVVFQFVASGAIAGALTAAFSVSRNRAFLLVSVFVMVLLMLIKRPDTGPLILRDLLYVPTLVASVWLAGIFPVQSGWSRIVAVLFWWLAFGACHLAVYGVLSVANGIPIGFDSVQIAFGIGGLVGLGAGLGVHLSGGFKKTAYGMVQ